MTIKLLHKGRRNLLICCRSNGTVERADLGPDTPFHDLAHFVAETYLGLMSGFYGNISKGFSVAELSDKEIIKTLPAESMVAEIVARALQSLWSGACLPAQFNDLVSAEFVKLGIDHPLVLSEKDAEQLHSRYSELITRWKELTEGEALELKFE